MDLRFGLLGAGRIGKVHAQAIFATKGARLTAVADPLPQAANEVAEAFGCRVETIDQTEAADDIDAVVICTPTDTHAGLIGRFTRAGKAVFCEKPIDLDLARVRACQKTVAETGGRVMVGFNRRFDPHFAGLKRAIADGQIGDVEMVQITSRDPGLPPYAYITRSGGIFRDMMIHDLDIARFLMAEEPVAISAFGSVLIDPEVAALGDFDSASVLLKTATGKQCSIGNSRRATYGYDQRIEVHGSKGMVAAENQRPISIEVANATGYIRPPLHDFFMTRYRDAYANEIAAFITALKDDRPMSPSIDDGMKALVLADAAERSARQGTVVELV